MSAWACEDARAKKKRQGGVQSGPPKCAESTQRECCFISQTQQVRPFSSSRVAGEVKSAESRDFQAFDPLGTWHGNKVQNFSTAWSLWDLQCFRPQWESRLRRGRPEPVSSVTLKAEGSGMRVPGTEVETQS